MQKTIVCLWARSERYQEPQFVGAVSDSLHGYLREEADRLLDEAKHWWLDWDDGDDAPWTFWTTFERLSCDPLASLAAEADRG